jgi:hypothetical protein
MRLYGKRFLRNAMESKVRERVESRDTIIWEIYPDERYCIVKVAGSSALVRAWFPRNTDKIPPWLKVGMTARIAHVGGERSRIEVIGHGLVLPAALSGVTLPVIPTGDDTIISGMLMSQTPTAGQSVMIRAGTYRIGGQDYVFSSGTSMGEGGEWHVGDGGTMTGDYLIMPVDPVSGGAGDYRFRFDAFVIGADGVVDYIKGDEWQLTMLGGTGPEKPAIPGGHVLIMDYILRWSGQDEVMSRDIGREYEAPRSGALILSQDPGGEYLPGYQGYVVDIDSKPPFQPWYTSQQDEASMGFPNTVTVYDQYGNPSSWALTNELVELEFKYVVPSRSSGATYISGYGLLWPADTAVINLGIGNSVSFVVYRNHTYETPEPLDPSQDYWLGSLDDMSPAIMITAVNSGYRSISIACSVGFLDGDGLPL